MAKVRFQMFIEEEQKQALERLQQDSKISVAEIVRNAIDRVLSEKKEGTLVKDKIIERLLSTAGICEGPPDLADKHDKYLYGINRK